MEYKVIVVDANKFLGSDFELAGEKLAEEVNAHIAEGWLPQGGVCFSIGISMTKAALIPALIRKTV